MIDTVTSTVPGMEVLIKGWEEMLDKNTDTMGERWGRGELLK